MIEYTILIDINSFKIMYALMTVKVGYMYCITVAVAIGNIVRALKIQNSATVPSNPLMINKFF